MKSRHLVKLTSVFVSLFLVCGFDVRALSANEMLDTSLTGNWLEEACNEGDVGPDLPPPLYSKGVIKFESGNVMRWSAKIFDDNKCTVSRPGTVAESLVHYSVVTPSVTTDGSIQIDVQANDDSDAPYTMYGMAKIKDGKLYFAMFPSQARRPKSLDERVAQVFAPM